MAEIGRSITGLFLFFILALFGCSGSSESSNESQEITTLDLRSGNLELTPRQGVAFTGVQGGSFSGAATFTLANLGSQPISFQVTKNRIWIDVTPNHGTLAGHQSISMVISPSSAAEGLPVGSNRGQVLVEQTSLDNARALRIPVSISVSDSQAFPVIAPGH